MWYQLHDTQLKMMRASNNLWQLWGKNTVGANHSINPMLNVLSAALQGADRLMKDYPKPAFGISTVQKTDGTACAVIEEVVVDKPFCKLLAFTKKEAHCNDTPREVFIVAPLSGHYATLLRDMVGRLLIDADIVWITDWKNARDVPLANGNFGFDDYVTYVEDFLGSLERRVHVVAVCQPAVPVMAATARMAERNDAFRPLSITLMGGPVDARKSPTLVDSYATKHELDWFKLNVVDTVPVGYPGYGRRVYPGFLQHFGFVAMNPQKHQQAYQKFMSNVVNGNTDDVAKHLAFYNEYNAVLDLDANFYLDTIDQVFQRFTLAEGTMRVNGSLVKPACINDISVFTIEGELDDIAGVGQTKAAHTLCKNLPEGRKHHWEVPGVGHYGIFAGSTFRTTIAPQIIEWMDECTPRSVQIYATQEI